MRQRENTVFSLKGYILHMIKKPECDQSTCYTAGKVYVCGRECVRVCIQGSDPVKTRGKISSSQQRDTRCYMKTSSLVENFNNDNKTAVTTHPATCIVVFKNAFNFGIS